MAVEGFGNGNQLLYNLAALVTGLKVGGGN
jgi:hypothetical protein